MRYLNPWLLFCLILLAGCEKEEIATRPFPRLETLPVTEVSDEGAVFNGYVLSSDGQDVLHHGFVWGDRGRLPQLSTSFVISEPGAPSEAEFSMEIRNDLEIGRFYLIRAYIQTEQLTIYGNEVLFQSLGSRVPVLTSVQPAQGSWGDTINVRGKFFSQDTANIEVFLKAVSLKVISTSDTLAKFVIPPVANQEDVNLKMITRGMEVQGQLPFKYEKVEIQAFNPAQPFFQDTVHLKLKNLNEKYFDVTLEEEPLELIAVFKDSLVFKVPLDIGTDDPKLIVRSAGFESRQNIFMKGPEVESLNGRTISTNQTLRVFAKNIFPKLEENYLRIEGVQVPLLDYQNDSLVFILPEILPAQSLLTVTLISGPFRVELGEARFSVPFLNEPPSLTFEEFRPILTFAGRNLLASGQLSARYTREGFFQSIAISDILMVTNDQLQIQLGEDLFPDPLTSTEENISLTIFAGGRKIRTFPLKLRYRAPWTKIGNSAYFYNPDGIAFSFGRKGYIGKGTETESGFLDRNYLIFEPDGNGWVNYVSTPDTRLIAQTAVFTIGDQAYTATGMSSRENGILIPHKEVYQYNHDAFNWNRVADFPGEARYAPQVMVDQSEVYLLGGKNDQIPSAAQQGLAREMWKFIPESAAWVQQDIEVPEDILNGITVEGQGYVTVQDGFYKFNGTGWSKIEIPGTIEEAPIALGQSAYWGFENSLTAAVKAYNFSTQQYTNLDLGLDNVTRCQYLFTMDGKAFFTLLRNNKRETWAFDPSSL